MVGGIYSDQRCSICKRPFQDNHKDGLICPDHPNQRATRFKVKFGRKICRRFAGDYKSAQRFLNGLRFKNDEGTFDLRDYRKDNPLGFETLASKWLAQKKKDLKKIPIYEKQGLKRIDIFPEDFRSNRSLLPHSFEVSMPRCASQCHSIIGTVH